MSASGTDTPTTSSLNNSPEHLKKPKRSELISGLEALQERITRSKHNQLSQLYPETGPLRRELYAKHLDFFKAGAQHMERACISANRIGKSFGLGGYETAVHLTGDYPDWWEGRRFKKPVDWWAAGDTLTTTRDIVQQVLLGDINEWGTGLIPKDCLEGNPVMRPGVPGGVDYVKVKHISGGLSTLGFKAYDQGRKTFQGTAKHGIWLDEECSEDVYDECLIRLTTTHGIILCTFTPLLGLSNVALKFLPHMAPEVMT